MNQHFTLKRTLILALSIVLLMVVSNTLSAQVQKVKQKIVPKSLHVQSVADQRIAAPGNRNEASVYVVVQSYGGLVAGLTMSNFTLHAEQVGAGGCIIKPVRVYSGRKGIYRIDIIPGVNNCTWKKGNYVISTTVKVGVKEGASVAVMPME